MSGSKGRDTSSGNEPVSSAIQACPKPRLELFYSYCDETGVPNAKYHVYSVDSNNKQDGLYEKKGTLNGQGRARLTDIPDVKQVCYYFEKDPKKYAEFPKIELTTEEKKTKAESLLDAAGAWVWGTLQGDFNKDPSVSQIAVNAIAGLIPLVDQSLDIRDIAAGSKDLIDFYSKSKTEQDKHENVLGLSYETYLWVNLFIIALGCFPVLGSAAKGVLKCMIMWMKRFGKAAGELSPQQMRHIWEMLVATLNNLGVGNAHRKLKDLLTEFPSYMDKASAKLAGALKAFSDYVTGIRNAAKKMNFGGTEEIIKRADKTLDALGVMLKKLEDQKKLVNAFFEDTLNKFIPHAHSFENLGGGAETLARTQRVFDPDWISEIAKAQGVSEETVLALMAIADEHGVIIKMRPTNPEARRLLAEGKHLPKPESIKAKTINDLDVMLGAKGQKGEASLFRPEWPGQDAFDKNPDLESRYRQRMQEYYDHFDVEKGELAPPTLFDKQGKALPADQQLSLDENGVIRNNDGKAYTGDNDIYEIQKADGTDFKKGEKEAVQKDLEKDPVHAQHGAHADWKPENDKDTGIKKAIDDKHEKDEKLVVYSPDNPPTQKFSNE
jgi:hypothetical protein